MVPKLLLVDINGTVTRSRGGSDFTPENDPTAIELLPGVTEALDRYRAMGCGSSGLMNGGQGSESREGWTPKGGSMSRRLHRPHIISTDNFDGYVCQGELASCKEKKLRFVLIPLLNAFYYEVSIGNGKSIQFDLDQFEQAIECYNSETSGKAAQSSQTSFNGTVWH